MMFDKIISSAIAAGAVSKDKSDILRTFNSIQGFFKEDDSLFQCRKSMVSEKENSLTNFILEPVVDFGSFYEFDGAFADTWYFMNGIHNFQAIQSYNYFEARVVRFLCTVFSDIEGVVSGTIFICGDKYDTLVSKINEKRNEPSRWEVDTAGKRYKELFLKIQES